jgi:hypothetical protein
MNERKVMGYRMTAALSIGLLGFVAAPPFASAVDTMIPPPVQQPSTTQKPATPTPTNTDTTKKKKKKDDNTQQKSSYELFLDGYQLAHALIYKQHRYEAGIEKLKSLGQDEHPDVANLIGYSSRKLGRYDDAKYWYEKALAADPNHARTWSYYGMWHAEQGNLLKARDYLAKVQSICGTGCREYAELKGVIEGTRLY